MLSLSVEVVVVVVVGVVVVAGGTIGGVVAYNSYQDKKQQEAQNASLKAIDDARNDSFNKYNERINQIVTSLNVEKDGVASIDNNEDVDAMNNAVNELNRVVDDINNDTFITPEQKTILNASVANQIGNIKDRINAVNIAREEAERRAREEAAALAEQQRKQNGYSNEELCNMARDYYYRTSGGYSPKYAEVDRENGNLVVIHLYNVVNDGPRSGHTATAAFYEVDRYTAKGQNITTYKEVDLNR